MGEKKTHHLKCINPYFKDIESGAKSFEIRKNDRDYKVGDDLVLMLYAPDIGHLGPKIKVIITYITNYEQKDGFVVMGIRRKK